MLKYARRMLPIYRRPLRYFAQQKPKDEGTPAREVAPKQKNVREYKFHEKVYAYPVKVPIIPMQTKDIFLNQTKMKFYKKYSPNYIVAMVKRSLNEKASVKSLKDEYYEVGTYCEVHYKQDKCVLNGLHRVQIENITKIELEQTNPEQHAQAEASKQEESSKQHPPKGQIESNPPLMNTEILQNNSLLKLEKQINECFAVDVKKLEDPPIELTLELQAKLKFLLQSHISLYRHNFTAFTSCNLYEAYRIVNIIAIQLSERQYLPPQQFKEFLQKNSIYERIQKIQGMLYRTILFEKYLTGLEKQAQKRIVQRNIYQHYLQIMKITNEEGRKAKQMFIHNSIKLFLEKNPNDDIKKIFKEQCQRYTQVDENSSESSVIKGYIEQMSKIPYNVISPQTFDIDKAIHDLDSEHYGMKEVKEQILELIAVGKLKGTLKGKALCFIGPPGLGKTTLASSIAKALGRKFYNISLGGTNDSSVLKGHRRTYVGAYSGKIINALKSCGTSNPVILLDEIDKMGSSSQGDPRSELLQILDPNQNTSFVDNYVDFPVDLSNVLFICSANYISNISKPLQDRLEKIYLTSYTNNEKKEILKRHILKRAIEEVGVNSQDYNINEETLDMLILDYSRGQPGVRYLERSMRKLLEKIAFKIVQRKQPLPIQVNKNNIVQYLGSPFFSLKDHTKIKKGVAIGLGDSAYGGRLTYIESVKRSFIKSSDHHRRGVVLTGSLGIVIKEAMEISYTFARNFLKDKLNNTYLYENEIHIHAPEGASKKDGPNDSITIATSLISLAIDKEVKKGIAMTGQLSLKGNVLKADDCKQKVLIAKREKIYQLIIPKQNEYEVANLTDDIKQNMTFHFVSHYDQVFKLVF